MGQTRSAFTTASLKFRTVDVASGGRVLPDADSDKSGTLRSSARGASFLPLTVSDSTPKVVLIAVFGISLLANFAGKSTVAV